MEALANEDPEIRLRRVDIVAWESEVAAQYGIRRLPTLWLYENGRKVAASTQATAARLQAR